MKCMSRVRRRLAIIWFLRTHFKVEGVLPTAEKGYTSSVSFSVYGEDVVDVRRDEGKQRASDYYFEGCFQFQSVI